MSRRLWLGYISDRTARSYGFRGCVSRRAAEVVLSHDELGADGLDV